MEFLRKVIIDLKESGRDPGDTVIVTPNRRAGLFIKKYMLDEADTAGPVWLPQLYSIQDFIGTVSSLDILDSFSLIFKLYPVYSSVFSAPRTFDTFYQWGSIVISDFNEIDLSLCDREAFFRSLREISLIEDSLDGGGPVMQDFIRFSRTLQDLYDAFTALLLKEQKAYYGLALRQLSTSCPDWIFTRWPTVVFAGFNALSRGETALIGQLRDMGDTRIYWDIDDYFLSDPGQEAGIFLRDNPLLADREQVCWITSRLRESPGSISIIGAAGRAAQAKVLGDILEKDTRFREDDTAVVLADEALLFPVLHSLPDSISRINVTMGYPLSFTSLYNLVSAVFDLHLDSQARGRGDFRFGAAFSIVSHPGLQALQDAAAEKALDTARKENRAFLAPEFFAALDPRLRAVFAPVDSAETMARLLRQLFLDITALVEESGPEQYQFELEYIYQFMTRLQRLEDTITGYGIELEMRTFCSLFTQILDSGSVPFLGEPLQGLQIMGLLETRALDFKNVIIMSANEGVLPKFRRHDTFVPNEVRRAHKLPTFEHEDAVYAYHFYRLLSGAEHAVIMHNTVHDAFGKGEMSRFIEQLIHEYGPAVPESDISVKQVHIEAVFDTADNRTVFKNPAVLQRLEQLVYTPTMLRTYLDCSLRFYYRYLLGLSEDDSVLEAADPKVFGNVIHRVIEQLFRPCLGRELTAADIDRMRLEYTDTVRSVYRDEMGSADLSRGRNFLYLNIIDTLMGVYLGNEIPGKTVTASERRLQQRLTFAQRGITLAGAVDRFESRGRVLDIIDFKTGKTGSLTFDPADGAEPDVLLPALRKKKEAVQLLTYYLLTAGSSEAAGFSSLRLGLYSFKEQKAGGGFNYLQGSKKEALQLPAGRPDPAVLRIFETVFNDIFSADSPFVQTGDDTACTYCPFRAVCGRY